MSGGPALTPALALDYVHELSADVRAGVVLDAAGAPLAGPEELAAAARELLAAGGEAAELEAVTADGVVCAVRSAAHAMVTVCGRFAIPAIVRQDMRAALAAVEGRADAPVVDEGGAAPVADDAGTAAPVVDEGGAAPVADDAGTAAPGAVEGAAGRSADDALARAAEALISAAQRGFRA
jgi:hypothetical protein